jgi:hypothetical protein
MVSALMADAVPQELLTVYLMVSVPGVTPETIPPATVALPLLLLHMPPLTVLVIVTDVPIHKLDTPVRVPAFGDALTVMTFIALAVPQLLVTV